MFSFGGSRKDDIFKIDDVRQLVLDFPYSDKAESSEAKPVPEELLPLVSGEGLIQAAALSKSFHKLLDKRMLCSSVTRRPRH